jgi:hypothetical protein
MGLVFYYDEPPQYPMNAEKPHHRCTVVDRTLAVARDQR